MNLKKINEIFCSEYFILSILTIIAIGVRLLSINKVSGLWYDEMLTYIFSSKNSIVEVTKALLKEDFHMPLYYFYVHGWMKLFGTSDIVLRLSSVFWGVLSVPAGFYLGKTYKSKGLGYFLASVITLSPIMIFFSQEFRFYSMLMFFSIIAVTFLLKLIETPSKKDFIIFSLANLVILYIYTMGIIFVSLEVMVLIFHFYLYKKENLKELAKHLTIFSILAIPYLILLASYLYASNQSLIDVFSWSEKITPYTFLILVNDWFSPFLSGIFNSDTVLFEKFFTSFYMFMVLLFTSAVSICFLFGIILSILKFNQKLLYMLFISLSFLLAEIILSLQGNLILVTKYTTVIIPILFLIACNGLFSIKKKIPKILILSFILVVFTNNIRMHERTLSYTERTGIKTLAEFLIENKINKNDYILFPTRSELLKKYINSANIIDFSTFKILNLDKTKQESYKLFDKKFIMTTNKNNAPDKLKPYLSNPEPTPELKNYINSALKQIPKGGRLFLISNPSCESYSKQKIRNIISLYNLGQISRDIYKYHLLYPMESKIFFDIKDIIEANPSMRKVSVDEINDTKNNRWNWKVYIYQKK